ncbi:peroxiredoxin [Methanocella sp. CWC-04]|uniref:Peroxiredoxin n=2 Tax=Methanooceanicella nereidis TaxID=2052831 RepID=A0AAP2RFR9_9EURY|nr:redoxin domain-containing protein [Methanocella sp. CWC-04]MCD1295775.1 peroxiredoxin [Methanocella sp. CWC-04]
MSVSTGDATSEICITCKGTGLQTPALKINDRIPDLEADSYYNNTFTKVRFDDYRGKWMVFIFYPADFTYVCPTELDEMASLYKNFTDLGAEVFSVSRDTAYVHKAWHDSDPRIQKIQYPMIADTTGDICRAFGTYNESSGLSHRASFIFDPDGNLKSMEIYDDSFGRNTKELLRRLEAAKFVRENPGNFCPVSWEPGEETIKV